MPGTATPTPTERSQARLQRSDRAEEWLAGSDLEPIPAESPLPPHDDAVRRLEGALGEQGRRRQYEAAFETFGRAERLRPAVRGKRAGCDAREVA